jgi:hypothetical protein
MKTPFSTEQFFSVIEKYNTSVFPMQFIFLAAGLFLLFWIISVKKQNSKLPAIFTGVLWLWSGTVYHILSFTSINRAAYLFGSMFILEGLLILFEYTFRKRLILKTRNKWKLVTGYLFIVYGLTIYPIISYFTEGSWSSTISLGLPCPTTILTFGFFLIYSEKLPCYLLIIPTLWSLLGISAALNFGVYQDFVMVVSAIVTNVWLFRKRSKKSEAVLNVDQG